MNFNPWEVWLANVEFDNGYESKNRPVIIIDPSSDLVIALECTSQPPKNHGDYCVDWMRIGLERKTVVKTFKPLCLPRKNFIHKIGDLGSYDINKIIEYREEYDKYKQQRGHTHRRNKREGCYIATSIYGSYDCPQVWVLRRYRDNVLANTQYGRIFIKLYYLISPKIIKIFGKNECFIYFTKKKLDKLIIKLKLKGYQDNPYDDSSN